MQFLRLSYLAFFGFIVLGVTAMPKPTPAPVAVDLAFGDQMDAVSDTKTLCVLIRLEIDKAGGRLCQLKIGNGVQINVRYNTTVRLSLLMSPVAWAKPVQLATGSTPIEYTFPFIFGDRALSLNAGPGTYRKGNGKILAVRVTWLPSRPQRVDNARAVADGRPGSLEAGRRDPPPITEQASDQ
ncbi:predicted protein, partial [Postia placenta Mad-698-R]